MATWGDLRAALQRALTVQGYPEASVLTISDPVSGVYTLRYPAPPWEGGTMAVSASMTANGGAVVQPGAALRFFPGDIE